MHLKEIQRSNLYTLGHWEDGRRSDAEARKISIVANLVFFLHLTASDLFYVVTSLA